MVHSSRFAYAERPLCGKAESQIGSIAHYIAKLPSSTAKMTATGRAQHAAPKTATSNAND
jgi:hypothetical protein